MTDLAHSGSASIPVGAEATGATMLEKAARALCGSIAGESRWDKLNESARRSYCRHARAVLMAVRDSDGDIVAAGERAAWDSTNSMPAIRAMSVGFTAMIDAILAHGEGR